MAILYFLHEKLRRRRTWVGRRWTHSTVLQSDEAEVSACGWGRSAGVERHRASRGFAGLGPGRRRREQQCMSRRRLGRRHQGRLRVRATARVSARGGRFLGPRGTEVEAPARASARRRVGFAGGDGGANMEGSVEESEGADLGSENLGAGREELVGRPFAYVGYSEGAWQMLACHRREDEEDGGKGQGELHAPEHAIKLTTRDEKKKSKTKDDKIKERVLEKLRATEGVSVSQEVAEMVSALELLHLV
ncbi:hypothetical protein NL676_007015 [Syzygium grande]|nr:hypothetical protein NL676_007015 [Syzygium grande]